MTTEHTGLIARLREDCLLTTRIEAADALEARDRRIAELEQDRDEWKDSTIAANENQRRAEAKVDALRAELDALRGQSEAVPKELLSAISRAGLTLIKAQHGYELIKLSPVTAKSEAVEPLTELHDPTLPYETALSELISKICPDLDSGDILDDADTASKKLSEPEEPSRLQCTACGTVYADGVPPQLWIDVADALPEWAARDDTPCIANGQQINATLTSTKVLVCIAPHDAVRVDNLVAIEGGLPWWDTYGERVTKWMPLPGSTLPATPQPSPVAQPVQVNAELVEALEKLQKHDFEMRSKTGDGFAPYVCQIIDDAIANAKSAPQPQEKKES